MDTVSGQYKAGRILLLVGAILSAVGAAFFVIGGTLFLVLGQNLVGGETDSSFGASLVGAIYLVIGLVQAVGCVFAFLAYGRANRGEAHGAWIFGLVASLIPPLQIVPLIGAILVLTSPEHARAK